MKLERWTVPEDGYRLLGYLPAGSEDAGGILRVAPVEGAVGYEIYAGRPYSAPKPSTPVATEPWRVPAAELTDAIRDRIDELCSCDEIAKAAVLAVLELHPAEAHECPDRDANESYTAYEPTCPTRRAIAGKLGIEAR
jgi:hypothetical protein